MPIIKNEAYYRGKIKAAVIRFDEQVKADPLYDFLWRTASAYRYWAVAVIRRDGKCKCCQRPDDLHAHHIKDAATHPELRFDIENGVTLCNECHKYIHNPIAGGYRNGCGPIDLAILLALSWHRRVLRRKRDKVMKKYGRA